MGLVLGRDGNALVRVATTNMIGEVAKVSKAESSCNPYPFMNGTNCARDMIVSHGKGGMRWLEQYLHTI